MRRFDLRLSAADAGVGHPSHAVLIADDALGPGCGSSWKKDWAYPFKNSTGIVSSSMAAARSQASGAAPHCRAIAGVVRDVARQADIGAS